jgi:membrane-bound lytic murein transglycosylase B
MIAASKERFFMPTLRLAVLLSLLLLAIPSYTARCGGDFNAFVAAMSQEAAAAGVPQGVISQAFVGERHKVGAS